MAVAPPLHCDFCGRATDRVRRVALDRGYDRLGHRHQVRYACDDCSRQKERARSEDGPAMVDATANRR